MRPIDADAVLADAVQEYRHAKSYYNAIARMVAKTPTINIATLEQYRSMEKTCRLLQRAIAKDGWILCSERLPNNEEKVLVTCKYRNYERAFVAMAFHTDGTFTTERPEYSWDTDDDWEYNEEEDAWVIPPGWWECVRLGGEFRAVDAEVLAWKPLPEPYKGEEQP